MIHFLLSYQKLFFPASVRAVGKARYLVSSLIAFWILAFAGMTLILASPAYAAPVQEVKTKGGLTAWLIQDSSTPALSMSVLVRHGGSAYDPEGKEGRAALAASLLTEGAGKYDAKEFHDALDFHAIRLGAAAGEDDLSLSLTTLSEHANTAFFLLHEMLAAPRFAAVDVKRLKAEQQAALLQKKGDPDYQVGRLFNATAFAGHPYARPSAGTPESVSALERADMQNYVATHIKRGEMIISVAGDITPQQLKTLMERHFDSLPKGTEDSAEASLPDVTPRSPSVKIRKWTCHKPWCISP